MTILEAELVRRPELMQPNRPWIRLVLVVSGLSVLGLFVVARFLTPDPSGIGTHEQLGMLPCGFKLMFDIPCPSCGMTTSWSWLVRGEISQACRTHFGGVMLGVFCGVFAIWLIVSGIGGRWFPGVPSAFWWGTVLGSIGVAILVTWILKSWT
jgi:hypothetical protein